MVHTLLPGQLRGFSENLLLLSDFLIDLRTRLNRSTVSFCNLKFRKQNLLNLPFRV